MKVLTVKSLGAIQGGGYDPRTCPLRRGCQL